MPTEKSKQVKKLPRLQVVRYTTRVVCISLQHDELDRLDDYSRKIGLNRTRTIAKLIDQVIGKSPVKDGCEAVK